MEHKEKVRLAIKMAGRKKKKDAGKKFMSPQWMKRKKEIAERVKRKQSEAHNKAVERKGL
jgi:hypothetical protein